MHIPAKGPGVLRRSRTFLWIGGVVIALTAGAAGLAIWDQRGDAIDSNLRNMDNLGVALAEQTSRMLQAVDIVVKETEARAIASGAATPTDFSRLMASEEFHQYLVGELKGLPQAEGIGVTNSAGRLVNTSFRWPVPQIDASDRDYYRYFRDHDDSGAFFSAPFEGQTAGSMFMVARRINGPRGEFLGVAHGAITVRYLEDSYKAITLQSGSSVTVLRRDGMVLARYPHIANMVGHKMPTSSPWYGLAARDGGVFASPGYFDGTVRIVAVHPLHDYPLVVNITASQDEVLAEWRIHAIAIACAAAAIAIGFAFLFRILAAQVRRLEDQAGALSASEARLAHAQHIARVGSDSRDLRTDEAEWSDESYRIFGVTRETFVPTTENFLALVHPEDRATIAAVRAQIRNGIAPPPFRYRIIRPDGSVRHILRECEVLRDEAGNPIGQAGTMHDITELHLAQLRQGELERQLLHSQKLEALGTLAGGIAHDLNNSLVPVLAMSKHLLTTAALNSPQRQGLELIHCGGERARDLVRQILTYARKSEPERRWLDLATVVGSALKLLRASLPASIAIDERIDRVPPVFADESQIHQVMVNLVTNAAQAIGSAPGRIGIELVELAQPGDGGERGFVRLTVSDSGCGMDKATSERIFEPFYTTKAVHEGTGLGLSVVHGIVTGHGGRIVVETSPGEGAVFAVYLPIGERDRQIGDQAAA